MLWRRFWWAGLAVGVGVLMLVGWRSVAAARERDAGLASARRLMALNRFEEAREALGQLLPRWRGHAEVAYRLGVCAHAAGDLAEALESWASVPAGEEPWTVRAGLARARTLVGDLGRFSEGEEVLLALTRERSLRKQSERDEVRHTLAELYFWEGRKDEMRRLIEQAWREAGEPVAELRNHWRVDNAITLIEMIRTEIQHAASEAPGDDRVWLAQASLALQTGEFGVARELLEQCLERRPEDHAVWRSALELALAQDDLAGAKLAFEKLSADRFTAEERLELEAWVAMQRGDASAEMKALRELLALTAGDARALERLASLEWLAGDQERAAELRARKSAVDAARDRYRLILGEDINRGQIPELAELAETLGRTFEARGWYAVQASLDPTDGEARQRLSALEGKMARQPAMPSGAMLAVVLRGLEEPVVAARASGQRRTQEAAIAARFHDVATERGLVFTYDNGRTPERQLPETTGGGVGLLDYDGDGWLDVYVTQGGKFPPGGGPEERAGGDRLFRNTGGGRFEDVTRQAGIANLPGGYGHGVAVGDYDNDGDPDLFLTRWRSYALIRNRGDGTFEDATGTVGLAGDRDWPTSAAFADLDNDGDLDLYVCHYLAWDEVHPTRCNRVTTATEQERSDPGQKFNYCTPRLFHALPDHLFRNDAGQFVDVTAEAGIVDEDGRGLGVVAADVDDDGLVDLYVANDTSADYLWHNLGGMKFEEAGFATGVACNSGGAFQAGMGTACGDVDGDGKPDLLVTNFYGESTTYFRNLGGMFSDQTAAVGLAAPSRFRLGFGVALLDVNNDGYLDLAQANGHVNDDRPDYPYQMPALLMMGRGDGRLVEARLAADDGLNEARLGRGLAIGDLDRDGRVDAVMLQQMGPLALLRNETGAGNYLDLALEGTQSNRDGVGAVATVRAGGRTLRAWRIGGGSFQAAIGPLLHFGLGAVESAEEVEVRWPSGQVDRLGPLEGGRTYTVREGTGTAVARP